MRDSEGLQPTLETVLLIVFAFAVYITSRTYDILERVVEFSWKHEYLEIDEFLTVTFFLSLAFLFLLIRRWRNLKRALSEIRLLRGIIPICASCKKIRDDNGYWHQVESYISQHSDVMFSHGLCPECMMKLYPEFISDHQNKN